MEEKKLKEKIEESRALNQELIELCNETLDAWKNDRKVQDVLKAMYWIVGMMTGTVLVGILNVLVNAYA
jgi:hypothetical protein